MKIYMFGEGGTATGEGNFSSGVSTLGEEGDAFGSEGTAVGGTGNSSAGSSTDGNTSSANSEMPPCFGIVSPIPAVGELNPYGTGLRVCYGARLVESRSCAY